MFRESGNGYLRWNPKKFAEKPKNPEFLDRFKNGLFELIFGLDLDVF